jgi:hypothetical protein
VSTDSNAAFRRGHQLLGGELAVRGERGAQGVHVPLLFGRQAE